MVYQRGRERIFKTVTYFLAETRQARVTLPLRDDRRGEHHDGFGWFLYRDAIRMLVAPNLKQNLKHAYALVVHRKRVPHPPRGAAR